MTRVFADTFYFLALLSPNDGAHKTAAKFISEYRGSVVTTAWVITEVANTMHSEHGRTKFIHFYDDMCLNPNVVILHPEPALFKSGLELFRQRLDKDWSLADCISFVVMAERKISAALTGDRHFEQAGFKALLK